MERPHQSHSSHSACYFPCLDRVDTRKDALPVDTTTNLDPTDPDQTTEMLCHSYCRSTIKGEKGGPNRSWTEETRS